MADETQMEAPSLFTTMYRGGERIYPFYSLMAKVELHRGDRGG